MSAKPLSGHTAVVTHGANGRGLAIARALAGLGAEIVLLDEDPDVGMAASRIRSDLGMPAMGARGDIADEAFVATAFRAAIEHLDFPDLVVLAEPGSSEAVVEAFRERLETARKTGILVTVVEGDGLPDRVDGPMACREVRMPPAVDEVAAGQLATVLLDACLRP